MCFAAIKCQLRGVPEDLRQALSRATLIESAVLVGRGEAEKGVEKGEGPEEEVVEEEQEHPYDVITRTKLDLEPYVLLLQVKCLLAPDALLCACGSWSMGCLSVAAY